MEDGLLKEDQQAACSFSTLMICSSVNLLCPSPEGNGLYPKAGAFKGSRSIALATSAVLQALRDYLTPLTATMLNLAYFSPVLSAA